MSEIGTTKLAVRHVQLRIRPNKAHFRLGRERKRQRRRVSARQPHCLPLPALALSLSLDGSIGDGMVHAYIHVYIVDEILVLAYIYSLLHSCGEKQDCTVLVYPAIRRHSKSCIYIGITYIMHQTRPV